MFEVYDRINRESILSGSREECNEYIAPLPQYLEYVVREKPTEELLPSDWWSGGFATNH